MLLTDKQYDEQYSWYMSNALFGHCLDDIRYMTVKRMPKAATMKNNIAKKTKSLDKQKFLLKFVAFEGLLQFQDGKFPEMQKLINDGFVEKMEEKRKVQARQSMNTEYYGSYPQEEVLVDVQTCGGYNYYPICLYDFTTKVLDHDHLVFSTRHLIPAETNEETKEQLPQVSTSKINSRYIDWNYCKKKCGENIPENDISDHNESNLSQSLEEQKYMEQEIFDVRLEQRKEENRMNQSHNEMDTGFAFTRQTEIN